MNADITAHGTSEVVLDRDSTDIEILLRAPYPNGLLIGFHVASSALTMLLSRLHPLVTEWDLCAGTAVPCIERGTLVIWNGDMLDRRAQRRLIDVLNRPHRIQILSIAPADLFDRVQRGEFLEALYYRLNTVRVQADAPSDI